MLPVAADPVKACEELRAIETVQTRRMWLMIITPAAPRRLRGLSDLCTLRYLTLAGLVLASGFRPQ